jgi:D-alanyl-D-alanine carboxypeptidase/D-alanyl-D-alanine-endopeptidase (penicillin-binding protein 4)
VLAAAALLWPFAAARAQGPPDSSTPTAGAVQLTPLPAPTEAPRPASGVAPLPIDSGQPYVLPVSSTPPQPAAHPAPFASAAAPWTRARIAKLRADLDRMLRTSSAVRGAHVGLLALDSESGAVLYDRAAGEDFTPASTLKLITGVTALTHLGRASTFHTALISSVPPEDGTIAGDLILRGGGDPLLRRIDLANAAATLANVGVRTVTGSLIVDAGYFDDQPFREGWAWDDLTEYYAVPPSAITLGESNTAATVSAAPSNDAPPGESVDPDPALRAGRVLAEQLAARGITIGSGPLRGAAPPATFSLWSRESPPLTQVLAECWFVSDNLTAEALIKALGVFHSGPPGKTSAGLALERDYLRSIGVDVSTLHFVDGSGLSRYDAIPPRALVQLLQHAWHSPDRDAVLDALPVSAVRGSLRGSFKEPSIAGRVYAKSGSMTHVVNLAGYLNTFRHGAVTFALLVDDGLWLQGPPEGASGAAGGAWSAGTVEDIDGLRARVFRRIIGD